MDASRLGGMIIEGGEVYTPERIGGNCLAVLGEKIAYVGESELVNASGMKQMARSGLLDIEEIDATGCYVVPGFVDAHVHIAGGGGEGGFHTRTPEIRFTALTLAGITTVVGVLGVDGVTRSVAGLLAKARALEQEGITTYIYTGAYEIPTRTITGNVRSDLVLIDKVIGVGEIAISDHRSAQPETFDLARLAAEARVGGLLGGKPGIVHLHLGRGARGLKPLFEVLDQTDLPISQFVPTHINRTRHLFEQAKEFRRRGGVIDLTAGVGPDLGEEGAVAPAAAFAELLTEFGSLDGVTISSDGNGSLPTFDEHGELVDIGVGPVDLTLQELYRAMTEMHLPLEKLLPVITSNPAKYLKLYPRKGCLAPGSDGDVVVLTKDLKVRDVVAKGRLVVRNGKPLVRGTFE